MDGARFDDPVRSLRAPRRGMLGFRGTDRWRPAKTAKPRPTTMLAALGGSRGGGPVHRMTGAPLAGRLSSAAGGRPFRAGTG
jgi:hypothetical protein